VDRGDRINGDVVMKIDERRVLVVGASSGVGRAVAEGLAARGARVAFAARRAELVEEAARTAGNGCIGVPCDVRDDASCAAMVAATVDAFDGLDTLIYAAAVGPLKSLRDMDGATWRDTLDINLIGAGVTTAAAVGTSRLPVRAGRCTSRRSTAAHRRRGRGSACTR
jgi:NAD(P)-dependent dehydrogenase (short-subunit alcohol dehydrogenase family)